MNGAVKERPILFSGPMIRALLDGRKTMTRRIIKAPYQSIEETEEGKLWPWREDLERAQDYWYPCPYGKPGDRLWVKEAWRVGKGYDDAPGSAFTSPTVWYEADGHLPIERAGRYCHARFMPRWASRITPVVADVRVERLQDISRDDVLREGIPALQDGDAVPMRRYFDMPSIEHGRFRDLWESINGPGSWDANPWVWVISFKRVTP